MKTPEDEAFDELAQRQGAWGGGFTAKRQAAMDKINFEFDEEYKKMHKDWVKYGTSWSRDGERIDPASVYLEEPAHCQCTACKDGVIHASDCAVHNGPAYPIGTCDCGVSQPAQEQRPWVGLTAEDFSAIKFPAEMRFPAEFRAGARWAEVKLKDKNT
jgi:hypothetical protein